MPHIRAESNLSNCIDVSRHTYEWVMSHIEMSPATQINESRHTYGVASASRMN